MQIQKVQSLVLEESRGGKAGGPQDQAVMLTGCVAPMSFR